MWLIFDVNGVITRNVELSIINRFCKQHGRNRLIALIRYFADAAEYYRGCMPGREFWASVLGPGGYEFVVDSYSKSTYLNRQILGKLKDLKKKGFRMGVLSNSCDIMSATYEKKGFYDFADRVYLSDRIHMIKPYHSTFRFVVNDIGADPKEVLLIDDSWYNIVAARIFGWRVIWFKDIHSLEKIESKFTPMKRRLKKKIRKRKKRIKKKLRQRKINKAKKKMKKPKK